MENKEIEINKTPITLKDWADSNYLYLTEKELENVEKHLIELSKYNYKKNAEESWREYMDEDKILYVTPTKQNVVATEKDFGETGAEAVIEVSSDVLKSIEMFEDAKLNNPIEVLKHLNGGE